MQEHTAYVKEGGAQFVIAVFDDWDALQAVLEERRHTSSIASASFMPARTIRRRQCALAC